jgi:hypothetical protein
MSFYNHAFLIDEHRYRYTMNTEPLLEAIILSDRKGEPVSLRELLDVVITVFDKGTDKFDALAPVCLIRLLKIGSLLLALRSPIGADVHHEGRLVCRLVFDCLPVNGRKGEVSESLIGMCEDRKEDDNRYSTQHQLHKPFRLSTLCIRDASLHRDLLHI